MFLPRRPDGESGRHGEHVAAQEAGAVSRARQIGPRADALDHRRGLRLGELPRTSCIFMDTTILLGFEDFTVTCLGY